MNEPKEIIAIGSDHAGFAAKESLKTWLLDQGYLTEDFGCYDENSVHYPVIGAAVAAAVSAGRLARGILICGTGIGMSIVANKFRGIRAALCHDAFTAQACREHNDANILAMGARVLSQAQIEEITLLWLTTTFGGGRHQQRLDQIAAIENKINNFKEE